MKVGQCYGSGLLFFSEFETGSAKNPDLFLKIRIRIRAKNVLKVELKQKFFYTVWYFISSTLNIVPFGQAPPKPYQNHHFDPIRFFMDGSGFLKPGSGLAKNPAPDPKHCSGDTKACYIYNCQTRYSEKSLSV